MPYVRTTNTRYLSPLLVALLCTTAALPVFAQPQAAAPAGGAELSDADLVKLLLKRGLLTKKGAAELMKSGGSASTAGAVAKTGAAAATGVATTPPADGAMHVTYVPEIVKKQLRDEIKQEVLAQAQEEHWAAPNEIPEWVNRIHLYGDIRMRYESDMYPSGNDNTGAFPNFNSINTGSPFDVSRANNNFPPQLNVDQDRNRFRLRARFGADADLGDGFTTGFRIGTGQDDQPVSENQSLGQANSGQGGNFSKYAIWLDRGYIKYERKDQDLVTSLQFGRFDNPFFSTNLIWWEDLAFDGVAATAKYEVTPGLTPFFVAGAFPIFNTDLNFGSNQPAKFPNSDRYLYAAQIGADWKVNHDYSLKVGVAYYDFQNVAGSMSTPCTVLSSADICNTDDTRPSFAQKGNTYTPLRNIIPTAANNFGASSQFQYFGLATPFRELALTGRFDFAHFDPLHIIVNAEFVRNLAFDKGLVAQKAVNNQGATSAGNATGTFDGGGSGYFVNVIVGKPVIQALWDWNASVGYKRIESDAVVDAFDDPDFGMGGTNMKGYILGATLGLSHAVSTRVRWFSADQIAGPPLKNDVVQVDLLANF